MKTNVVAALDGIFKGGFSGSVAKRLLAANMNPKALRTNDILVEKEWQAFDTKVQQTMKERLVCVGDLVARGLTYSLTNGLATKVLAYQREGDAMEATLSMSGLARGQNDRPERDLGYLPLPICHADWDLDSRDLAASRTGVLPLDVSLPAHASRAVAAKNEDVLINGSGQLFTFGGGSIYGYTNFPSRVTGTPRGAWTASGVTASDRFQDVKDMKKDSLSKMCPGPWMLYVCGEYETCLDEDYNSTKGNTLRERIMQIGGIVGVKAADKLADGNILLVPLVEENVQIVVGLQPTNVEWESQGGFGLHFKTLDIIVPRLRADKNGNCGLVHYSA